MKFALKDSEKLAPNHGLPPLNLGSKPYSYFEFWPAWFFYIPVLLYWLVMSLRHRSFGLPLIVNPHIPLGGMVGESKAAILDMAGEHARTFMLPFLKFHYDGRISAESCLRLCEQAGLQLPLVVKPDLGCRGTGVRLISSEQQLQGYLKRFPLGREFLMQRLAPYSAEAGVFYVRDPEASCGRVVSITLKYQPLVVGDGEKSLRELIECDPRARKLKQIYFERQQSQLDKVPAKGEHIALAFAGSHSRGSIFRNGNAYITEQLEAAIDSVMQDFPDFHYGRLDIKFANIEDLTRGQHFALIEVNGVSSEATHIWDSRATLGEAFATLFWQYRTLFSMGRAMRARGYKVPSIGVMLQTWFRELRQAKDYPQSD
ncbi:MAG: D-alanine--D-alanine ligase [Cellvibrionaceae bacterium]|nr:D-alanine--D-alanine ligase [Cellvibrionaceae bacterium]